jgi:hypothetical protein
MGRVVVRLGAAGQRRIRPPVAYALPTPAGNNGEKRMARTLATKPVKDDLEDLHQGLHVAMRHLHEGESERAMTVLRQVDARMAHLINHIQIVTDAR